MSSNITNDSIVQLLAESLGVERALELVVEEAANQGLNEPYEFNQAIAILEGLSKQSGTVGIIARFAKGRAILHFQ